MDSQENKKNKNILVNSLNCYPQILKFMCWKKVKQDFKMDYFIDEKGVILSDGAYNSHCSRIPERPESLKYEMQLLVRKYNFQNFKRWSSSHQWKREDKKKKLIFLGG